ncbi:hypothetical protein C8R44DRAFT_726453 [Mycena epipterygia]|nr:hypothetical protein C8R44DRAFT_726453 [Mycena epipterygia]
MTRGRKALSIQVKAQHRKATLERYAEKNREKLREAARLRMQRTTVPDILRRVRAEIANSDDKTRRGHRVKAQQAAATYREKNREEIRAADTMRRASRCIEQEGLQAFDKKASPKSMGRAQRHHEQSKSLPTRPKKPQSLPKKPKRHDKLPEEQEDDSDSDNSAREQRGPAPTVFPERIRPDSAMRRIYSNLGARHNLEHSSKH